MTFIRSILNVSLSIVNVLIVKPATELPQIPVMGIYEEDVPMAVSLRCFTHWIIIGVALIYALYTSVRVLQNKQEIEEETEIENS